MLGRIEEPVKRLSLDKNAKWTQLAILSILLFFALSRLTSSQSWTLVQHPHNFTCGSGSAPNGDQGCTVTAASTGACHRLPKYDESETFHASTL
jgi:hypothetical protein